MTSTNKKSELLESIEKYSTANLLIDYKFDSKHIINAAKRVKMPTVADRVSACRYSVEEYDAEILDVIVSGLASSVLQFGMSKKDKHGVTMDIDNPTELPTDFIINHFDYSDLIRINALMGKGSKHVMNKEEIERLISLFDIAPLAQKYTYNDIEFNAAFRLRRPVVRDHIEARSYSTERWGNAFSDIIIAGSAANTMTFGTLTESNGKPVLINQVNIPIEFIVNNFIYPDLMLLNRLLVKSPASSVSGAKR